MPSDKEFQKEDTSSQQIIYTRSNSPQFILLQIHKYSRLTFTDFILGHCFSCGKSLGQL